MRKNIMITGCAGFIGSHAADYYLELGHSVVGVDCFTYAGRSENIVHQNKNKDFKLFNLDICDTAQVKAICKSASIDWILNFAAETHVDNSIKSAKNFIHSNIEGVRSLLEVCKDTGVKLLHVSTDEVYGSAPSGNFLEDNKLDPRNPYSATKAAAEHLINAYSNTHGVNFLIVRPSNNFGPRQHKEKFLPTIVRSIRSGKKIPVYGDGKHVREWLFVEDNVRAIHYIMKNSDMNQTFNISSGNEMVNLKVIEEVCSILGKTPEECIEFVPDRPGHDFRYSISNTKLADIGFKNYSDFSSSLEKTISYYMEKE